MPTPPPPEHTRWKPGFSPNPGGKTSEHRKAEVQAAELAAKARLTLVQAFANLVENKATEEEKLALMDSDALKLLKESEDRGFGTPKASVDLSSEDGSMSAPSRIEIIAVSAKKVVDGG